MARLLSRCVCLAVLSVIAASVMRLGVTSTSAAAPRTPGTSTIGKRLSELKGADTGVDDFFGDSVAISGTTAVVGAEDHAHDAGRAYLFSLNQAGWSQVAEVEGADTVAGDDFGWSVAIGGDTVVVGAPSRAKDAGRAYVFGQTSAGWAQVAVLKGTGTVVNDGFGASVAVSGTTAVVGASGHDDYAGAAYVFTDTAGSWHETAELEGPRVVAGDEFGWSVAISGLTVVVGVQDHADDGGLAYVFEKTGRYWTQTAELKGSDTVAGDFFGDSVAISGATAVIGAWGHNRNAGRVYVFEKAKGHWRQVAELKGSDTVPGDFFGDSVAVSGSTVVVGAENHASDAGRAYVFTKTATGWKQVEEVDGPDTVAGDWLGYSVALSGATAVVGAPNHASSAGRAYVFAA
ncbi:MAG: FG-GAP repeat protein [Acidimicrobiales bacterium]